MILPMFAARPSRSPGSSLHRRLLLLLTVALGIASLFAQLLLPAAPVAAVVPTAPAASNLSLALNAAPNPVLAADPLVYTVLVSNSGPDPVGTPVTLTDPLPAGASFVAAAGAGWTCSGAPLVTCVLPSLAVGSAPAVLITITAPISGGPLYNTAFVSAAAGIDADLSNNSASVQTVVTSKADLSITAGGPANVNPLGTVVYTINVSSAGPSNMGFATFPLRNSAGIAINDNAHATPYPATIVVTGLHQVLTATAGIYGFSHTFPEDVDVMLAAPGGAHTLLMADPTRGQDVSNIDLGFDDAASAAISCADVLLRPGIYQPTNCPDFFGDDNFQSPAPAGPYSAALSVFHGADANGVWKLFVRDDTVIDAGSISSGWGLTLTTELGTLIVTDTLPAGMTFVAATGAGWNCAPIGQVVQCVAADFVTGVAPQIVLTATAPFAAGALVNNARAGSLEFDPNPADNVALVTTTINTIRGVSLNPPSLSGFAVPSAAITYTLRLSNTGNATDSYTVTVAGNAWPSLAPAVIGPLPMLTGTNVQVVVTVPGNAIAGTTDSATITVRSQGDPSKTDVTTLTTTAARALYLPVISR